MSVALELDEVIEEIRSAQKFLITTHENPDGDALGSLIGMHELLKQLGKVREARVAFDHAIALATNAAECAYIRMQLDKLDEEPGVEDAVVKKR